MCDFAEMFPFPLSDFQKKSIQAITDGNHVFTAAPTGSGKTVSAEFAIRHFSVLGAGGISKRRVIYTSPIKALSNQKYWELSRQFPTISFGLLTGDVKINPGADVLVMTTEILQNFLFATYGASTVPSSQFTLHFSMNIETELACVIFDEVHYILDRDRGSVWERSILMLPEHVQLVMLSATFARPDRFAEWVFARYRTREVVVASTDVRSVPLIHYAYFPCTEAIFKITKDVALKARLRAATNTLMVLKDSRTAFSEHTHTEVCAINSLLNKHRIRVSNTFAINCVLQTLVEKDMLPAIVFVFSRKRAEYFASKIQTVILPDDSKVPYTAARRCNEILRRLPNHSEYAGLPEFDSITRLAEKGVAYHHSGMLAVFREMVEILISEKYIKVLVCTESFSIGLNCPIRTTVFTGISKMTDGGTRNLLPHEYQQCAGRAGRRGIDTVGHVVHCSSMFHEPCKVAYRRLLSGTPPALVSTLRIDALSVLGLIRAFQISSVDAICGYLKGTMMALDARDVQTGIHLTLMNAREVEATARAEMARTSVPVEVVAEFVAATAAAKIGGGKSRLKLLNKMSGMRETYSSIEHAAAVAAKVASAELAVASAEAEAGNAENKIKMEVQEAIQFLIEHKFVSVDDPESSDTGLIYEITQSGAMAAAISEVNGMVAARCIEKLNYFRGESLENAVVWLALFADVKPNSSEREEFKEQKEEDDDEVGAKAAARFAEIVRIETALVADPDEIVPCISMAEIARRWVAATTEVECKVEMQRAQAVGISMGEFVRAMLKVAALARECAAAVEFAGQLDCAAKFAEVDKAVLKFVVSAQSLYV